MLVKVFGAIDVLAGLILILGIGINFPIYLFIIFGIVLLAKSFINFLRDSASWIDFLTGLVLILFSIIYMPLIISLIFGILILQKGVVSFL